MTGPRYDQYTLTVTVVVPSGSTPAQVCAELIGRELPGTAGSQVIAAGAAPGAAGTHTGATRAPTCADDDLDDLDEEPEPDEPYE